MRSNDAVPWDEVQRLSLHLHEIALEHERLVHADPVRDAAIKSRCNTSDASGFAMLGRKIDLLNMNADAPLVAQIIEPTHRRARTA
ncbi:hypothetical protein UA18_02363 [Burkholderia multivorans]|uniref:Uncharacterized protein n=1 Tax=Burkholderia multivorans TaxID=87883 RepID=A0ABD7LN19_9BURK|nr:hypothetical protein UA18_02363 [Burkholderia multivorans]SAK22796.1 hypothetical protein UA17_02561 [Burkholderia multivorans]